MAEKPSYSFGHRLRELREQAGLTQQQLADSAGVHRNVIARLETVGDSAPRWETVLALAKVLGTTPNAFLPAAPAKSTRSKK